MNLLAIHESFSALSIVAALIPSISFLILLLYYTMIGSKKNPQAKIVTLKEPIKVIGVSTKTTNATFVEDDHALWKEYKLTQEKKLVTNKQEEHSFVAVKRIIPGDNRWEYFIGDIVTDLNNVPVGLKALEIPAITYAAFHVNISSEKTWANSIFKIEHYIYKKWIPRTKFKLDTSSDIREIEYHDKPTPETTRTMIFYVPITKK